MEKIIENCLSEKYHNYRSLEKSLLDLRIKSSGNSTDEEDNILEAMLEVWVGLSDEEKRIIYDKGPKIPTSDDFKQN